MIVETGFTWRGIILYALVGVPLALLQHALGLHTGAVVPEFTLVLVVHAAFFRGAHEAGGVALLLGAVADALSGGFFGFYMLRRVSLLIGARALAERIYSESPVMQMPVVFGALLLDSLLGWLLLSLFTSAAPALAVFAAGAPLKALTSALVAAPLAWLLTTLYALPAFNLAKRGLQT